jgi:hypothetical protein
VKIHLKNERNLQLDKINDEKYQKEIIWSITHQVVKSTNLQLADSEHLFHSVPFLMRPKFKTRQF